MNSDEGRLIITIRAVRGEPGIQEDARQQFWKIVKAKQQWSDSSIEELEQTLISRFGSQLQSALLSPITQRLSSIRYELFGHDLERYLHFPERRYYPGDISGVLEARDARLFSIPEYQQLMRRALLASGLAFGVEIRGYASLELALIVNRLDALVDFFDADASLVAPLLVPFVATAFAEVFDRGLDQEISVGISTPRTIPRPATPPGLSGGAGGPAADHLPPRPSPSEPATRAQWLWLVANSSLLIPVLLTLFVAYQAVTELRSLRAQDSDLVKPILQHQLELLKESRERERVLLETALQALGSQVRGAVQQGAAADRQGPPSNQPR